MTLTHRHRCMPCSSSGSTATTPCSGWPGSDSSSPASRPRSTAGRRGVGTHARRSSRAAPARPIVHLSRGTRPAARGRPRRDRALIGGKFGTGWPVSSCMTGWICRPGSASCRTPRPNCPVRWPRPARRGCSSSTRPDPSWRNSSRWAPRSTASRRSGCASTPDTSASASRGARSPGSAPTSTSTWRALGPADPRLPDLVDDVQSAVAAGLPAVLDWSPRSSSMRTPTHFHLHDGHPLDSAGSPTTSASRAGCRSRSSTTRPRSLDPLYGVDRACAAILSRNAAVRAGCSRRSPWRSTRSRRGCRSATQPACSGTGAT